MKYCFIVLLILGLTGCGELLVSTIEPNAVLEDQNMTILGDGVLAEVQMKHNWQIVLYKDNKSPMITLFRQGNWALWRGEYACGNNIQTRSNTYGQGTGINGSGGVATARVNKSTVTSTTTSTKMCQMELSINADIEEFTLTDFNLNYNNLKLKMIE